MLDGEPAITVHGSIRGAATEHGSCSGPAERSDASQPGLLKCPLALLAQMMVIPCITTC